MLKLIFNHGSTIIHVHGPCNEHLIKQIKTECILSVFRLLYHLWQKKVYFNTVKLVYIIQADFQILC